jgi:hypothetical protein
MIAITSEARIYALAELSRRAGVSNEFFLRWRVAFSPEGNALVVQPQPGASAQIRFPFAAAELQAAEVVRKTWYREAPVERGGLAPDFIVPFCTRASIAGQPLFTEDGPQQYSCSEDILASIALTLSRFEEIISPVRDAHGRFPASASLACRHNYLDRPVVDEYGLALEQILTILMPGWQPAPRSLRVKLTHDIDEVGIPFNLRGALGHVVKRKAPLFCARDLLSLARGVEPAYLTLVRDICRLSIERSLHSALFWMAAAPGPYDAGYDVADSRIAGVMRWARDQGIEMGVHPGYETFLSPALLGEEVQRCRAALQNDRIGGRQHYLRWSPESWLHWERCGLQYDSTVGFADHAGFRAGTCVPYLPWLWKENRRADVLEIPLIMMDATLVAEQYMALDADQIREIVKRLVRRCAVVGGVFTVLWHNDRLAPPCGQHYPGVLDALSAASNYDWQADLAQLRELSYSDVLYKPFSGALSGQPAPRNRILCHSERSEESRSAPPTQQSIGHSSRISNY